LPCESAKTSESLASAEARRCAAGVAVSDLTSATTEVVALPDGQFAATVHAGIVRVKRGEDWVPVDLTLRAGADGIISTVADPFDVRLSGARGAGGAGEVASLASGGDRIRLGWAGALPVPMLAGSRATYADALPGVDLVVDVRRTGLETLFVLKNRAALGHVRRLSLPVTGAGIAGHRTDAAGGTTFVDSAGRTVATSPALEMWDAATVPTERAGTAPSLTKAVTSVVERTATGVALTLTPDEKWLAAPERVFPITIDPELNPVQDTLDTWVRDGLTADQSTQTDLRIGREGSAGPVTRSFVRWNTTAFANTQVTSATANFWNWYSGAPNCTSAAWEIWNTTAFTSATRWTSQPPLLDNDPNTAGNQPAGSSNSTSGGGAACDDAWVAMNAVNFFRRAASEGQTTAYMGIKAADETVVAGYKQFRSDGAAAAEVPYARVVFNRLPAVSALATAPVTSCDGSSAPLTTMTPTLKATVSDADGGNLTVKFEWWKVSGTAPLGTTSPVTVATGGTAQAAIPAGGIPLAGSYQWRALVSDATYTTVSQFCRFTLSEFAPPAAGCAGTAENDYNGDGVTDVAVADPKATVGSVKYAGAVHIMDGAGGPVRTLDESLVEVPGEPGSNDRFGQALASYDANRDGCTDLAVGMPYEDVNGNNDAGSVRIIFGAQTGLGTGPTAISMQQGSDGTPEAPGAYDWFGFSLAAGRISTGEGFLVIGAPGQDVNGQVDAGVVHYRRPGVNVMMSGLSPNGANRDDRTGYALAATPYHLGVASPGELLNGQPFAGAVCTLTHTLNASGVPTLVGCVSQADANVSDEPGNTDSFGKSIAMAPYRAPGAAAGQIDSILVVGVPGEDQTSNYIQETGIIQQFHVKNTGLTELPWIDQETAGITSTLERADYWGEKVLVVNTNPTAEASTETLLVAVGIPGEDLGTDPDADTNIDPALDQGAVRVFPAGVGADKIQEATIQRGGALPGEPVGKELIGASLGGNSTNLFVATPYGDGSVWTIPWSALANGTATPTRTWQPGADGLPADAVDLGAVIR
jgi:hypothetical protein